MISTVRPAIVALLATLATASVCLGQESTPSTTPAVDSLAAAPAIPPPADVRPAPSAITTGTIPSRGGIGGQLGLSSFRADRVIGNDWFGDYSAGAQPRLVFDAHWRYHFRPWLRGQLSAGFTWAGYREDEPVPFPDPNYPEDETKEEYLTLFVPVAATLQFTRRTPSWAFYAGAGPGVYRVWVQNRRKVLKDPVSLKLHRGLYPGVTGELGAERFLKSLPNVSLEGALAGHLAMSTRDEQFPSGFNSHVMVVALKFGANYYFLPGDRKKPAETTRPIP